MAMMMIIIIVIMMTMIAFVNVAKSKITLHNIAWKHELVFVDLTSLNLVFAAGS